MADAEGAVRRPRDARDARAPRRRRHGAVPAGLAARAPRARRPSPTRSAPRAWPATAAWSTARCRPASTSRRSSSAAVPQAVGRCAPPARFAPRPARRLPLTSWRRARTSSSRGSSASASASASAGSSSCSSSSSRSSGYFHKVLGGSRTTAYLVAVASVLSFFASLILHELGHALVARRLGIPIAGIDLWFFGGLSQMRREPQSPGEELKVAAAGPRGHARCCSASASAPATLIAASGRFSDVALDAQRLHDDAGARAGRLARLHQRARCSCSTSCPRSRSTAGASRAPLIWWRTGDRNRATRATGRAGQGFALLLGAVGLWGLATGVARSALFTHRARVLPLPGGRRRGRAGRARRSASATSPSPTSWTASR